MKRFLTVLLIALMAGAMVFAAPTFTGNAKINLTYNTVLNQHTWDAFVDGDGLSIGFSDDLWSIDLKSGTMSIDSTAGITGTLKLGAVIAKSIGYQTKSTIDLKFGWDKQTASMYYTGHSADTSIYGDLNKLGSYSYLTNLVKFKKLTLANQITDSEQYLALDWNSGFTGKVTIGYAGFKVLGAVAVNERSGAQSSVVADNRQSFGFAIEGANLAEFINFSAGVNIDRGVMAAKSEIADNNLFVWKINANFDLGKVFGWGIGFRVDGFAQFLGTDNAQVATELGNNWNMYAGQVTGTFGAFNAYVEYTNEVAALDTGVSTRLSNVNVGGSWKFNPIFSLSANLCIPAIGLNWGTVGEGCELGFDAGVTAGYGNFTAYAGATKGVWKGYNNEVGFKSNFKFVF